LLCGFWADLRDQGAEPGQNRVDAQSLGAALLVVVPGAVSLLDGAKRLVTELLGSPGALVRVLLLVVGIICALLVITAKEDVDSRPGFLPEIRNRKRYRYPSVFRTIAKVGLALAFLVPGSVRATIDDFSTLPTTIVGRLVWAATGQPVEGARVRVIADDGADVTLGDWHSDSDGYYILRLKRRVKRTALLSLVAPECTNELRLPLRSPNESNTPNRLSGPGISNFEHSVTCKNN
jgi:hypothetical protein